MENMDIEGGSKNNSNNSDRKPATAPVSSLKVYCGNLPVGITNERIRKFMGKYGEIERCDLINRNPKKPFAFVTYVSDSSARDALAAKGEKMDGRLLIINRSFPPQGAQDGSMEYRRTIYIGGIPLGMSATVLQKQIMEAIKPITAEFRTHQVPTSGRKRGEEGGMVEIKTRGSSSTEKGLQMFAFLVFKTFEEAMKAGNILYELEVEGQRLLVEFSKGRKMSKYKSNDIRTIHIGNLAYSVTKKELSEKFRLFGEVTAVRLMSDRETGKSKGYAFLDFARAADADHACTVLNGTVWDDRAWKVQLEVKERKERDRDRDRRTRRDDRRPRRSISPPPRRRRRSESPPRRRQARARVDDLYYRVDRVSRAIPDRGSDYVTRLSPLPVRNRALPVRDRGLSLRRSDMTPLHQTPAVSHPAVREQNFQGLTRNPAPSEEVTLFVSNLPTEARDHRVRYLLEQLTGPMVNFKKEGPDGWLTYEDAASASTARDILRDHRIEGIRLVVEVLPSSEGSGVGRVLPPPRELTPRELPRRDITPRELPLPPRELPPRELPPRDLPPRDIPWRDNQLRPAESRIAETRRFRENVERDQRPEIRQPREYEPRQPKRVRSEDSCSGKLFVGNLSYNVTPRDIRKVFQEYGVVTEVSLPLKNGNLAGFGFVQYENPDDALYAQRTLNGYRLDGRSLRVEHPTGENRNNKRPRTLEADSISFESKRPRVPENDAYRFEPAPQRVVNPGWSDPYSAKPKGPAFEDKLQAYDSEVRGTTGGGGGGGGAIFSRPAERMRMSTGGSPAWRNSRAPGRIQEDVGFELV